MRTRKIADVMTAFSSAARIEGVHPLQCGIVRRKVRTSRRHGMPIVNPLIFYPVRAVEFVSVVAQWLTVGWRYHRIKKRVLADPRTRPMSTRRRARRHRGDGERRVRRRLRRQDPGYLRRPEEARRRRVKRRERRRGRLQSRPEAAAAPFTALRAVPLPTSWGRKRTAPFYPPTRSGGRGTMRSMVAPTSG